VGKWLAREVTGYVDTIRNAVLNSSVEWNGRDYPFYELDGLASEQKDEADRHAVMMLKGGLQREVFNPIFASREEHLFESVKRFYPSYLSFVSDMRHLDDLPGMIDAAGDFFDKTDSLYRRLMEAEAKRWSGGSGESMTRDDYLGLFSFPGTESRFPAKIMYPLIKELVTRMGFPQSRQKGDHKITIDDSLNPKKSSAPVALGVSVPNDIRISFRPQGGLRDYENLFHEIGHALHMAGTKVPEWIFRHLGDKTATESYAGIFGSLVTDPQFLEFYRDFVAGWNSSVSFEERVPVLTEAEMGRIVRLAALRDLYMVRRYNYAKVIFESARIGGAEEMLGRFGLNSCGVSKGAYALLFGKAYGMDMEEWEAERYLVEAEDDFYAADYARSFIVRPQLARKLREEFGSSWFVDGEAGRWLRENFFSQGNYFTPADLKERFDLDPNDYSEFERDLRWRLLAAERLEMGRGVPERP